MSSQDVTRFISSIWDEQIVPRLVEYIKIPNKSPAFDAKWAEHGYMDQAVSLMEQWARAQPIAAARGTRNGNVTTLENAAYSACPVTDENGCPRDPSSSPAPS